MAQSFEEISTAAFPGLYSSSTAFADFDSDDNLDVVITGSDLNGPVSRIYKNNGNGTFTHLSAVSLTGIKYGHALWFDYNNDNHADLLLAGLASTGRVTKLYKNNGNSTFTELTTTGLPALDFASAASADFNNDGFTDLILTGNTGTERIAKVFGNNADGTFTLKATLTGVDYGSVAVNDTDGDGDNDLFLCGNTGSGLTSKLYINNGSWSFTQMNGLAFPGLTAASAIFCDMDSDGDADLLLTGLDAAYNPVTQLWRNLFSNNFALTTGTGLPAISSGHISWSDADNDGDPDLFLCGISSGNLTASVYLNNADYTFTEQTGSLFPGITDGMGAWGDFNNDHHPDLFLTGASALYYPYSPICKLYKNLSLVSEAAPAIPEGLNAAVNGQNVTLSWQPANDDHTPAPGLRYNLNVTLNPAGTDRLSPLAKLTSGFRKIPMMTNAGQSTAHFNLKNLPYGTYTWSVQAIDAAGNSSAFYTRQAFLVGGGLTLQASNLMFTEVDATRFKLTWTNGNGTKRVVFIKQTDTGNPMPENATTYTADTVFGQGTQIGTTGWYCAYNGTGNSVFVTSLAYSTTYRLMVCEYIGEPGQELYLTATTTNNPKNQATLAAFSDANVSLLSFPYSTASLGDYDNDGDFDIVINGGSGSNYFTKIIKNNGNGNFIESNIQLQGVSGRSKWCDFDNNGNLDLLVMGYFYETGETFYISKIYRNNGNGTFSDTEIMLEGMSGSSSFGDYDQDGDLDLIMTGYNGEYYITKIYRNDGSGIFTDLKLNLPGGSSSVSWADYDNDQDLDFLLISLYGSTNYKTEIYKNIGNSKFITSNIQMQRLSMGSACWGDYNSDGNLDILLTGYYDGYHSIIYRNNGNGNFENSNIQIENVNGPGNWGDYDNDGDLDILLSDDNNSIIYTNNGNGSFDDSVILIDSHGSVYWFDYDNDGDLDIFQSGDNNSKIFRNNLNNPIIGPNEPDQLHTDMFGEKVDFKFNSSGANTDFTYNLYISDSTMTGNVKTPMSMIPQGQRLIPEMGNLQKNNSFTFIPGGSKKAGTYYWSVQSINNAYQGSAFATEQSFTIPLWQQNSKVDLPGLLDGGFAWGDYDNDHDLDLFICGSGNSGYYSGLYRNDGNNEFLLADALFPIMVGQAVWQDYDGDGWMDLTLTGYNSGGSITKIFRNFGNGHFADIGFSFPGVMDGTVLWADFYNDGKDELLINGVSSGGFITQIYKYNGANNFTLLANTNLPGTANGSVSVGDYDHDGDLDIAICGNSDIGLVAKLFTNTGLGTAVFSENTQLTLPGVWYGGISFTDYNADGWSDLFLFGFDETENVVSTLYSNQNGVFSQEANTGLPYIAFGKVLWTDFDSNGYPDILMTGADENFESVSQVYLNQLPAGTGFITQPEGEMLILVAAMAQADYDKDGDPDLAILGTDDNNQPSTRIIQNNAPVFNEKPQAPTALRGSSAGNQAILEWDMGLDDHTPQNGLTYNIAFGTQPGVYDLVFPQSVTDSTSNGFLKRVRQGNEASTNRFVINNLPYGKYYWRVQVIDASGNAGTFSSETYLDHQQYFSEQDIPLQGVSSGSITWGDYDNDGDLDILATGYTGNDHISKIYRNNFNGTFTDMNLPFQGGSSTWFDYDNDGDLDILLSNKIYRNDGNGSFTDININLQGYMVGSKPLGDFDNDGDLDILVTSSSFSKIYRNNGDGGFDDMNIPLQGVSEGSVAWGDYDNDGDLDILLTGQYSLGGNTFYISKIYRNNGNATFTDMNIPLQGVSYSSVSWGDYDNDGDLDILLTGRYYQSSYNYVSKIYRNNGNGSFTDMNIPLKGVNKGEATWGDYDNDGDLDILLAGQYYQSGTYYTISKIYCNIGNGTFTDMNFSIPGVYESSIAWGDYDNDGDLDILLTGNTGSTRISKIYKNHTLNKNYPPVITNHTKGILNSDKIYFQYSKASDNSTPQNGLTYNLRISNQPGLENVKPGMSDSLTGYRRVVEMGNVQKVTSWPLKNAPSGDYYWSVQAIDNGFMGGPFSEEQHFRYERHDFTIPQGWSGISSYVVPGVKKADSMFMDYVSNLVILRNLTGMYYPSQGINTLGLWNEKSGYVIKTSAETAFTVGGFTKTDTSLVLTEGWQIIPVLRECNMPIEQLFMGSGNKLGIVKEVVGNRMYWPAYAINTLTVLEPGLAYYVYMNEADTVSFPACSTLKSNLENVELPVPLVNWDIQPPTPESHIVLFRESSFNILNKNDVVGLFTSDGLCTSAFEFMGEPFTLMANPDDAVTQNKDGFVARESISIRVFRPSTGETFSVIPEWDHSFPNHDGLQTPHGLSGILKMTLETNSVFGSIGNQVEIYPSPVTDYVFIKSKPGIKSIKLNNSFGQSVLIKQYSNVTETRIEAKKYPRGVYFLEIGFENGAIETRKIILQ